MGELKRNAINVEHPGQLADAARELAGLEPSAVGYHKGFNYVDENGNPLESIPDPGVQPSDYSVPAINSPGQIEQFMLRSSSGGRARHDEVLPEDEPEPVQRDTRGGWREAAAAAGNIVHLDDAFAIIDGQSVPLTDIDLGVIGRVVLKALERKMKEDYARLKKSYGMQLPKRKSRAVRKSNTKRRKVVSASSGDAPPETTETA